MTIKMDENLLGTWFLAGEEVDWLAALRKESDHYLLSYRFRYYHHDPYNKYTPDDGLDRKSWWSVRIPLDKGVDEALGVGREMQKMLHLMGFTKTGCEPYELINKGDYQAFIDEFVKAPHVHVSKQE